MTSLPPGPVAVTGAEGFIGHCVVEALEEAGCEVIAVVRRGTASGADRPVRQGDLAVEDQARAMLAGAGSVVHLAARSGGIQLQRTATDDVFFDNVTVTRNVLRAAAAASSRRVFLASTAVVYSSQAREHPLTESARILQPDREEVDPYAWSKLTDEQLARWIGAPGGMETVVGRFDNVYGPGASFDPARSTVVQALVKKAVDAAPDGVVEVWGTGKAQRSFVHVRDAARATVTILRGGDPGRAYNISTTGSVTIAELAEQVVGLIGDGLRLRFRPDKPEGEPRRVLDDGALRGLGFRPTVPLIEGLREVVAAYRERAPGHDG